ncbi:SSI family serine proteinase inhibitor [Actinomadura rugatobispora]|uniref:SSI family serine proteinase inhibitor n=1 Tax=Actinomadura rugatobispora TaxID=1994 RepID=A0ABW1A9C5_9ACTN|nr:hypothetical protein GCM10010200_030740 [Actinomadura rugatobispora]
MPHLVATALTGAALALLPAVPPAPSGGLPGGLPWPVGAAAAGTADPAAAPPAPPAAVTASFLRLTLTHPGQSGVAPRTVTLLCEPAGGTHPEAGRACEELGRSQGVIGRNPRADTACLMIYAPVIAEASGHWHGRPVRFRTEYGNDCAMTAATGAVFRF